MFFRNIHVLQMGRRRCDLLHHMEEIANSSECDRTGERKNVCTIELSESMDTLCKCVSCLKHQAIQNQG